MAWVPLQEASILFDFIAPRASLEDSFVFDGPGEFFDSPWTIVFHEPTRVRIGVETYVAGYGQMNNIYTPAFFSINDGEYTIINQAPPYPATNFPDDNAVQDFYNEEIDDIVGVTELSYVSTRVTSDYIPADQYFYFFIEVWQDEPGDDLDKFYVYELDKGWTFDGNYIPHFVTFNWYFGEDPTVYTTMQKVRVHGLSKGLVKLQVQTSGIQTDYKEEFSEPEFFDLKNPYDLVSQEFVPATNYADLANRGLAIQLRFEGRNTVLTQPEPSHVLQVLVTQSSPQGSGFTSN